MGAGPDATERIPPESSPATKALVLPTLGCAAQSANSIGAEKGLMRAGAGNRAVVPGRGCCLRGQRKACLGRRRDLEGCYSNQKRLGEPGRQAMSDLLAQVFKGSCF